MESNRILTTNNAHQILNRVASDTQSLVSTRREHSLATKSRAEGAESVIGDEEFDFDNVAVDSVAYRRALQKFLRAESTRPSQLQRAASAEEIRPLVQEDSDSGGSGATRESNSQSPAQQQTTTGTEGQAPTSSQPTRPRKLATKSLYRNVFKGSKRRQTQATVSGDSASDSQVIIGAKHAVPVEMGAEDPWEKIQGLIEGDLKFNERRSMPKPISKQGTCV
jgi:hypothetical protein